jgi:hypothetical protein
LIVSALTPERVSQSGQSIVWGLFVIAMKNFYLTEALGAIKKGA